MPVIPTRSPVPGVATQPLPGVRLPTGAPREAFGGVQPPDFSGVQQEVAGLRQQEKQKANQIAVNDADNQASTLRDQVLYGTPDDPSQGILNKRGKDAFAAPEDALSAWNKGLSDITDSLSNDEQKLAFHNRVDGYDHNLHEQIQAHIAAERKRYETDTTNAYVQNRVNDAVQNSDNPALSEENVDKAKAILADYGKSNGWSPDLLQEQQQKIVSQIRFGVIEKMVTAKQDLSAQAYLAQHAKELLPTQLEQAQRLTGAASVLGEGQRQSQSIVGSATSLADATKQAEKITDPQVQEETKRLLRQHYEDQATSERLDRNQTFDKSWQAIQQNGGNYDAIPLTDRLKLSPTQVEQLQKGADSIRHPVTRTDGATYTHLLNLAGLNAASRQEFANTNLLDYRDRLSDSDFRYLARLQSSIMRGDDRSQTAAAARLHRSEEATTLKALDTYKKAADARQRAQNPQTAADSVMAAAQKYLPPITRPTVPQWMADSAKADPNYMDHLIIHGYDPKLTPVIPQTYTPPKAPGLP